VDPDKIRRWLTGIATWSEHGDDRHMARAALNALADRDAVIERIRALCTHPVGVPYAHMVRAMVLDVLDGVNRESDASTGR
jgi:hypothetical protein